MILWYAAIVFVAGSLHRRWKTPRGAGPSIWFLDLPWGDWSVAIDVASATWQVSACGHSEKAKLEEGRRMQYDGMYIHIFAYNHRRIRKANGQTWYTLWPAESSPLVFFFRGIQCQTKARSRTCSFSCQWDWWSHHGRTRQDFQVTAAGSSTGHLPASCFLAPMAHMGIHMLVFFAKKTAKGSLERRAALSQTSFADFLPKRLLWNFTAKAPDYHHYLLKSLPNFF